MFINIFFTSSAESSAESGLEEASSKESSGDEGDDKEGGGRGGGEDNDGDTEPVNRLGQKLIAKWEDRKSKLDHDYTVTDLILCVMPEVRGDVGI